MLLLQPTYFAPIVQYIALSQNDEVKYEIEDNYQKQTYRNRCYIYGANGKQMLNIPIVHTKINIRKKTKDVKIDYNFPWSKLHIKTLQTAYRSSPYFEFYEDEILAVFNKKYKYLLDLNFETIQVIADCLQLERAFKKTTEYKLNYTDLIDLRYLANAKSKREFALEKYTQVFGDRHGYISNLSILDLLFNEGTNALQYLEEQKNTDLNKL